MFFAEDIVATIRAMNGSLVAGGRLAITTLGPKFFSPMFGLFLDAATTENPAIDIDVPWHRPEEPNKMRDYLTSAGVVDVSVSHEVSELTLRSPDDWWRIAMGTGIRRLAMDLDADALERVRQYNLSWIREHELTHARVRRHLLPAAANPDQGSQPGCARLLDAFDGLGGAVVVQGHHDGAERHRSVCQFVGRKCGDVLAAQ